MATKHFCDICGKEIKGRWFVAGEFIVRSKEYCRGCWVSKKNWAEMHKVARGDSYR